MTAAERRADLDATLATIDATLADWETDRREAWIEENLNHPGQLHVCIAKEPWFELWVDGKIADDEAQARADDCADEAAQHREECAGLERCWICSGWVQSGVGLHPWCRVDWDDAVKGTEDRDAVWGIDTDHHWSHCLRSDGTGWGGGYDENGNAVPPPEAELVDGVGIAVSVHAFCMARLK